MTNLLKRRHAAFAGVLAAAALASAAPAQAQAASPDRCEGGVERLETQFREIEERRGYDAAVKWWDKAWAKYYENCVAP